MAVGWLIPGCGCAGAVADAGHSVCHQRDAVLHDGATECAVSCGAGVRGGVWGVGGDSVGSEFLWRGRWWGCAGVGTCTCSSLRIRN